MLWEVEKRAHLGHCVDGFYKYAYLRLSVYLQGKGAGNYDVSG